MSTEIKVTRSPETIAAEINGIKAQAGAVMASAFSFARRSVFEIGKRLEEAKCLLPHGEWGKWLDENVAYSESTANNIMRCYREFGDEQIDMLSGVSDAEFFGTLSQSQMVELFALPKAERREFVEEHREELESGEMSVRDLKLEIAKLKREKAGAEEALEKSCRNIHNMEKDIQDLSQALADEKNRSTSEPVVQEVIVNKPSEEQMEAVRAEVIEQLRAEFDEERRAIHEEYDEKISDLEKARDEAEKDAAKAEKLEEDLIKAERDRKASLDKVKADHEKKMAEMEATYQKKLKAATAGSDADVVRVQIALSAIQREMRGISAVLNAIRARGEEPKADKLGAQIENQMAALLNEAGWTV